MKTVVIGGTGPIGSRLFQCVQPNRPALGRRAAASRAERP